MRLRLNDEAPFTFNLLRPRRPGQPVVVADPKGDDEFGFMTDVKFCDPTCYNEFGSARGDPDEKYLSPYKIMT